MPKLGEFIGALLSDAAQARVRADLEALKIAETYSAHELLKHLPVPRFRLPDITVEFPVLVSAVEGAPAGAGERTFDPPTEVELTKIVRTALAEAQIRLPTAARDKASAAVSQRAKRLFETGPQNLLSSAKVSGDLAAAMVSAIKDGLDDPEDAGEKLDQLRNAAKASFKALLLTKLAKSPSLQVNVTAAEVKAHGNNDSVVRVRLTITEDAYEVINRDEGEGFTLTPE